MFTEPQSVTVATVAKTLPRVSVGNRTATYESVVDGLSLKITHVIAKRKRRTVRLDITKTAADPLLDGVSRQYSMSAYLVIDSPLVGFSPTEEQNNLKAIVDWLAVAGNQSKVINGES